MAALAFQNASALAPAADPVVLSFSTVGDSPQDPVAPDPTTAPVYGQDSIWLQSTKAESRILISIANQKSDLLFFNGDMIMGYGNTVLPADTATIDGILASDLIQTCKQCAFWRGMVSHLPENGTYVFPVPGNHEVQWKAGGKKAQVANENAWRANMGDLLLDTPRFRNLFGEAPANQAFGDNRDGLDRSLRNDRSRSARRIALAGRLRTAVANRSPTPAPGPIRRSRRTI